LPVKLGKSWGWFAAARIPRNSAKRSCNKNIIGQGRDMSIPRIDPVRPSAELRVVVDDPTNNPSPAFTAKNSQIPRTTRLHERKLLRLDRDQTRGYSINVKQVVLAFAVEFWIIGLIIVGTYLLIAESANASREEIFAALLLPAALAMVELARVPLALAVRTQDKWHVKFFAALGVLAAIIVTSFSLSQIAWKTFDIRIAEATRASDRLSAAKAQKDTFQNKVSQAEREIDEKLAVRNSVNERLGALEVQVTKVSSSVGTVTKPVLGPDGRPVVNSDGQVVLTHSQTANVNQAQLNTLKVQIASTKKELEIAETAVRQARDEAKKNDPRAIDNEIAKAEAEYRTAVNKSQLHSYTSMVTGKAVSEVTESEVKNLEKYLIIIPSIAAAFASTLIAITAVRRIKPLEPPAITALPDEAAAYLFGPLLDAIKSEANDAVVAAINKRSKTAERAQA
jgi:hypothetical protein